MGYKKTTEQKARAARAKFLLSKLNKAGIKDVEVALKVGSSVLSVYLWRMKGRAPDQAFLDKIEKMAAAKKLA